MIVGESTKSNWLRRGIIVGEATVGEASCRLNDMVSSITNPAAGDGSYRLVSTK